MVARGYAATGPSQIWPTKRQRKARTCDDDCEMGPGPLPDAAIDGGDDRDDGEADEGVEPAADAEMEAAGEVDMLLEGALHMIDSLDGDIAPGGGDDAVADEVAGGEEPLDFPAPEGVDPPVPPPGPPDVAGGGVEGGVVGGVADPGAGPARGPLAMHLLLCMLRMGTSARTGLVGSKRTARNMHHRSAP